MFRRLPTLLALTAAAVCASALPAQVAPPADSGAVAPGTWTPIGSFAEDEYRLRNLHDPVAAQAFLLRSTSTLPRSACRGEGVCIAALDPRVSGGWNSRIPHSPNTGGLWAGRGWSGLAEAGIAIEGGPFFLVLAPEVAFASNAPIALREDAPTREHERIFPSWQTGRYGLDLPIRPGEGAATRLGPGQSTVGARIGTVELGLSTEHQWWGPGLRNAILLSNNAEGFPHLFARTAPVWTPLGDVAGRWFVGELRASDAFHEEAGAGRRGIGGAALTLSPWWEPNLSVGIARTTYAPAENLGDLLARGSDVFFRWSVPDTSSAAAVGYDQILSLFARWMAPAAGAEVWVEWARHRLPSSARDLLTRPDHTQGFSLGVQWLSQPIGPGAVRLQAEMTQLEQSATFRAGRFPSYYVGESAAEGYTHRGRVLGAAIGPGASSQWAAGDFLAGEWRLGAYGGRIRWYNDAYFTRTAAWPFLGHDVSLLGGLRAGARVGPVRLEGELGSERRYNYLFQNWGVDWSTADHAVDVWNHQLRLRVSPVRGR